jgi:hypothetical protein
MHNIFWSVFISTSKKCCLVVILLRRRLGAYVLYNSLQLIKFVQTNKEKLTLSSKEDNNGKESEEPDYDGDRDQLEEEQEEETGEKE